MKRILEIQLILLIAATAAQAQTTQHGYPQRWPLAAHPSFQINLASGFEAPQFQILSDQSASSMPAANVMIPGQPTPATQTPTLARRPQAAAPRLAAPQPVAASQQLTFRGPPIRPAKPFIGWKFGQAAQAADNATERMDDSPVQLVPQYSLQLADNPAPPKTRVASKPNPNTTGTSGKFFSLQNKNRNQPNHTFAKRGRQRTAVASAPNGRKRR